MKNLLTFLLIYTLAFPSFASDCRESITYISAGTPASCTGFLYSPDADAQAAVDHIDVKHYKLINKKLTDRHDLMLKQNEILDKRLKLYMDQSHVLSQELQRKDTVSTWKQVGWFLLGISVTGIAVYGAGQLQH